MLSTMMPTPASLGMHQSLSTTIRQVVSRDDDSEPSPEPSPVAPPAPEQHPGFASTFRQDGATYQPDHLVASSAAWTPKLNHHQQVLIDDDGEESIPSLPAAPSPYSPPPGSLFSEEEFPPRSLRKERPPIHEVHAHSTMGTNVTSSASNYHSLSLAGETLGLADLSIEGQLFRSILQESNLGGLAIGEQHPQSAQSLSNRSLPPPISTTSMSTANGDMSVQQQQHYHSRTNILPAVLSLKNDLRESRQSLHLVQEENKALAAECDHNQSQLNRWQESAARDKALAEQHEAQLKESVEKLTRDNQQLAAECDRFQSQLNQSQESAARDKALAEQHVAQLKESVEKLTRDNQQLAVDKTRMSGRLTEMETLQQRLEQLGQQNAYLSQQVEALVMERNQGIGKANALENENKILNDAVATAQARTKTVEEEQKQLQHELEAVHKEVQDLRSKVKRQSLESAMKLKEVRETLETKQRALKDENSSNQNEIDRMKAVLMEANRRHALGEVESTAKISELGAAVERLQSALKESTARNNALRAEKAALRRTLAERPHRPPCSEIGLQTEEVPVAETRHEETQTDPIDDAPADFPVVNLKASTQGRNSLTERLERIRDAAERAALVHEYRRELDRIKQEHEAELRRQADAHDETLREVVDRAKGEVGQRVKEQKRRLQHEHEEKIVQIQKTHVEEMSKLRDQYEQRVAVSEQVLEQAVIEATSTASKLVEERTARLVLEDQIRKLESEFRDGFHKRSDARLGEELNAVVSSIQSECNYVFERNKRPTRPSPKSVVVNSSHDADPGDRSFDMEGPMESKAPPDLNESMTMRSTTSALDRALDETEALVRSLVDSDFRWT